LALFRFHDFTWRSQDISTGIKDDEWYTQEIIVNDRHIELKINGKTMVDDTEPDNEGSVFKGIRAKTGRGDFCVASSRSE